MELFFKTIQILRFVRATWIKSFGLALPIMVKIRGLGDKSWIKRFLYICSMAFFSVITSDAANKNHLEKNDFRIQLHQPAINRLFERHTKSLQLFLHVSAMCSCKFKANILFIKCYYKISFTDPSSSINCNEFRSGWI